MPPRKRQTAAAAEKRGTARKKATTAPKAKGRGKASSGSS